MKRKINYYPLESKVLAVSVANYEEDGTLYDLTAYVDAVAGYNHKNEYPTIADTGNKIPREVACLLFPGLDKNKWRN